MNEVEFINNGWNVLDNEDFKTRFTDIFEKVSATLTNTLGPYGSTTIIERHGNYHATKDGWSVLKNIRFSNPISNNIMQMISKIAAQVVIKVGDGSTSAVVAANEIMKELEECDVVNNVRPQDFMNMLNSCVEEISSRLLKNAQVIDKTETATFEDIRKLAFIATNSNEEVSDIIQTIYKETRNPSIDFVTSRTTKTSYDILEGYKLPFMTYIDTIFVNNDDGTCVVPNPALLMVDFKLEFTDTLKKMISFAQMRARELNRKLVIVCPFYDQFALEGIKRLIMGDVTAGREINTIFTRVSLLNNMADILYNDFCILTGGTILRMADFEDHKDDAALFELTSGALGLVDKIVIGKDSTISGFFNKNEFMYEKVLQDAKSKYDELMERDMQKDIITTDTFELKRRLARLACKMGIIHIGGGTELAKEANKDLIEDAVKACESAYNYGYNVGCNLSIVRTIEDIVRDIDEDNGDEVMDNNVHEIFIIIKEAFLNVYKAVLGNKFTKDIDSSVIKHIIDATLEQDRTMCYDLLTNEMSTGIINPCYTDIEILKAATSIISYIVTSNQYISIVIKEG